MAVNLFNQLIDKSLAYGAARKPSRNARALQPKLQYNTNLTESLALDPGVDLIEIQFIDDEIDHGTDDAGEISINHCVDIQPRVRYPAHAEQLAEQLDDSPSYFQLQPDPVQLATHATHATHAADMLSIVPRHFHARTARRRVTHVQSHRVPNRQYFHGDGITEFPRKPASRRAERQVLEQELREIL